MSYIVALRSRVMTSSLAALLIAVAVCVVDGMWVCPVAEKGGPLRNEPEMGDLDFSCENESQSLFCCMSGGEGVHIAWLYRDPATEQWRDVDRTLSGHQYLNGNQTLAIDASQTGMYRCHAWDKSGQTFTHDLKLTAMDCGPVYEPPKLLNTEFSEAVTYGANATFTCMAWFNPDNTAKLDSVGCVIENYVGIPNIIQWNTFVAGERVPIHDSDTKYGLVKTCSYKGSYMRLKLTIWDVTSEDLGTYQCWMSNDVMLPDGSTTLKQNFNLIYDRPVIRNSLPLLQTVVPGAAALLFLAGGLVLLKTRWLRMQVSKKDKRPRTPAEDSCSYDLAIIHSDSNIQHSGAANDAEEATAAFNERCKAREERERELNETIQEELVLKLKYTIMPPSSQGQSLMSYYGDAIDGCDLVIIFVSETLIDGLTKLILDQSISENKKTLFVSFADELKNYQGHAPVIEKAVKLCPPIIWTGKNRETFFLKIRQRLPPLRKTDDAAASGNDRRTQQASASSEAPLLGSGSTTTPSSGSFSQDQTDGSAVITVPVQGDVKPENREDDVFLPSKGPVAREESGYHSLSPNRPLVDPW